MTEVSTSELEAERDFLLRAIEDLDRDHVSGALVDEEYIDLRDQHVVRAASVIRTLRNARPTSAVAASGVSPKSMAKAQKTASWLGNRQRIVWSLGVVALVGASVFGITQVVEDRNDGDSATGSVADNSTALLARAQSQTADGKAADAVKTYDKVLDIDPGNAQALTYRGWLLNLAGFQDEGLASIQRAIDVQPTFADPHFFKGYILLNAKNDANGAVAEFETFLANNPPPEMVSLVQQALTDARARAAAAATKP